MFDENADNENDNNEEEDEKSDETPKKKKGWMSLQLSGAPEQQSMLQTRHR